MTYALVPRSPHETHSLSPASLNDQIQSNCDQARLALISAAKDIGIKSIRAGYLANEVLANVKSKPEGCLPQLMEIFAKLFCLTVSDSMESEKHTHLKSLAMLEVANTVQMHASSAISASTSLPLDSLVRSDLANIMRELEAEPLLTQELKAQVPKLVSDAFIKLKPFFDEVRNSPVESLLDAQANSEGEYLKKLPDGRVGTVVKTVNGGEFELLNKISDKSQRELNDLHHRHFPLGSFSLAHAKQGKVRFARNLATGEIVVVKKFSDSDVARREVDAWRLIRRAVGRKNNESKISDLAGFAHIKRPNPADPTVAQDKSYLFYRFSNRGDAFELINELANLKTQSPDEHAIEALDVANKISGCVSALHLTGGTHRDIKPENILYHKSFSDDSSASGPLFERQFRLSDFSGVFPAKLDYQFAGDFTPEYLPPEVFTPLYDAKAHDAFSLGLTLMVITQAEAGASRFPNRLVVPGLADPLQVRVNPRPSSPLRPEPAFLGLNKPGLVQFVRNQPSLEGVIACLLQTNSAERMSVIEASELLSSLPKTGVTPSRLN